MGQDRTHGCASLSAQEQVLFSKKQTLVGVCSQLNSEVSVGSQLVEDVQEDSPSSKEGTNLIP